MAGVPQPGSRAVSAPGQGRDFEEGALDLRKYFLVFRKWKWAFLVVSLGAASAVIYFAMKPPKVYAAPSVVEINPRTPRVMPDVREVVELGTGTFWANKEFFTTQYQNIKGRAVAQR